MQSAAVKIRAVLNSMHCCAPACRSAVIADIGTRKKLRRYGSRHCHRLQRRSSGRPNLLSWRVTMADNTARTIEAPAFRIDGGALVLLLPAGCGAAYAPGTWLTIEEAVP